MLGRGRGRLNPSPGPWVEGRSRKDAGARKCCTQYDQSYMFRSVKSSVEITGARRVSEFCDHLFPFPDSVLLVDGKRLDADDQVHTSRHFLV